MIFTLRTTIGQEKVIIDLLLNKIKDESLEVYSLIEMADLKGYILVEADSPKTVELFLQQFFSL